MRTLATFAVTVGLTLALARLPMPGTLWHAVRWAAYVPILAVSCRHGPIAGLWAGVATSLLWAVLTVFLGGNDVSWLSFLVPDFALVGLFGGRLLGVRRPVRLESATGKRAWPEPGKTPESAIEFNLNPIASIQSAAGLLAEEDTSAEVRHELADIISTECGRLATSITNLAERSAAATPPQFSEVDFKPIIDSAVGEAEFVLCERGIVVEKEIGAELPRIQCSPDQIRSLLMSLITNAIESAQTSKKLALDVHSETDGVLIEVRAGGRISAARRVLERFLGLSAEPASVGLAAAYHIVQRHGGSIKAKVNARKGFEFLVWLPLRQNCANGDCPGASGGGRCQP